MKFSESQNREKCADMDYYRKQTTYLKNNAHAPKEHERY